MDNKNNPSPESATRVRKRRKGWRVDTLLQFLGIGAVLAALGVTSYVVWSRTSKEKTASTPAPVAVASSSEAPSPSPVSPVEVKQEETAKLLKAPTLQQLISDVQAGKKPAEVVAASKGGVMKKPEDLSTEEKIRAAVKTIQECVKAATMEEKLPYFIPQEKLLERMQANAEAPELKPGKVEEIGPKAYYKNGHVVTTMRLAGRKPQLVVISQTQDIKQPFLIDFDSFIGWSERYNAQLMEEKPARPTLLRAYVSRNKALPPTADGKWDVELLDKWQTVPILARVEPGLLTNEETRKTLENGLAVPMVVKVAYEKTPAGDPYAVITEVVTRGWHIATEGKESY
jgi:hypothetical protein